MNTCKSIFNCLQKSIQYGRKVWIGCYKYGDQGVTECKCWINMLNNNDYDYFIYDFTNENSDIDFDKYLVEVKNHLRRSYNKFFIKELTVISSLCIFINTLNILPLILSFRYS